jgi:hypothetical protein
VESKDQRTDRCWFEESKALVLPRHFHSHTPNPPVARIKSTADFKDHHVYDVAIQSRGHSVLSESRSFCSSNLLRRGITQRSVVQINLRKLSGARQFPWKLQAPEKIKKRKSWFAKNRCRSEAPDVAPYTPLPATVVAQRQVGHVGAYRAGAPKGSVPSGVLLGPGYLQSTGYVVTAPCRDAGRKCRSPSREPQGRQCGHSCGRAQAFNPARRRTVTLSA